MRASILFRAGRHYRADAFARGLVRHGYTVSTGHHRHPRETDLLVVWNRTMVSDRAAATYERAGARVVVAENGYLDRLAGEKHYALALGHHNGVGRWFVGDEPRFRIENEPLRELGPGPVLVLPQRGIGEKGVAMPPAWPRTIVERLKGMGRPVIVRKHPGHGRIRQSPLESDLERAACVVTWGSGAGIKAIRAGVPTFYELDGWIGGCAATRLADSMDRCDIPDRGELWRRVSWGQWALVDIESGEAFDRLLHEESCRLFCARQSPVKADRGVDGGRHPGLRR